ncbi:UNVERIFIED_ORG: omptin family outer membrane protease (plasmid) [Roseateles sp. XES5]|nr:omptin family outer membrane protease [Roseateles sp. XES5]
MVRSVLTFISCVAAISCAPTAFAADSAFQLEGQLHPDVQFLGGIGVLQLKANEIVYLGSGNNTKLSHLVWETTSPMASAEVRVRSDDAWTLRVSGQAALDGDGFMADYDWIGTAGDGWDEWSDRSRHPGTSLDRYLSVTAAVGHDFDVSEEVIVNVNAGLKYTEAKWTSVGGSFVYSDAGGFRNEAGEFEDVRVISYRQQLPMGFAGLDISYTAGKWTLQASAKGGLTFRGRDRDNHWLTDTRFTGRFEPAPTLLLGANAEYTLDERTNVFLAGSFEKIFRTRGGGKVVDTRTGQLQADDSDVIGADFRAASIVIGIKRAF